ncbi:hypothetical protein HDU83_004941 [Entophlyctis luteolus]|nr:hypothetical protein HDU83_004941 [Entophlyctis luteolus]
MIAKIFCALSSDINLTAFHVDLDMSLTVSDLKKAIRAKKEIPGSVELTLVRIWKGDVGRLTKRELKQSKEFLSITAYGNGPEDGDDDVSPFRTAPGTCQAKDEKLLIRKSYEDIFEIISAKVKIGLNTGNDTGTSGFVITGNPGIDGLKIFVFSDEGCFTFTDPYLVEKRFLQDMSSWYLTDTLPNGPSAVGAVTIVVASPAGNHYNEFLKFTKTSSLLYLPVWTLNELHLARPL